MNGLRLRPLLSFAFLAWSLSGWAGDRPVIGFEAANKLYEEGKYGEAARAYESLLASGVPSPAIYFNLGNARFKAGQIGRAIASYRLAKALSPRDPDVRANLRFARNTLPPSATASRGRLREWISRLTLNEWTLAFAAANWTWFGLLIAGQWRPEWKPGLRAWVIPLGAAGLLLAVVLSGALNERFQRTQAIVIAREAVVRYGPIEESQSYYTVPDGAELAVLGHKESWLQVEDGARRIGWLQSRQVLEVPAAGG